MNISEIPENAIKITVSGPGGSGKTRFLMKIEEMAESLNLKIVRGVTPEEPHTIVAERLK